jgi:hypothetical protein
VKLVPAVDALLGKSHAVNTRVTLHTAGGVQIAELPIEGGQVVGDAFSAVDRWSATLDMAGMEWMPQGADSYLSGLSAHQVRISRMVAAYDQPVWVEVCRLWVYESDLTLSRTDARMTVRCTGPGGLMERAATDVLHRPQAGETCQAMIIRILTAYLPYTPTVKDTTTSVPVPADYERDGSPLGVAEELAEIANARVFFDAVGDLIIRRALQQVTSADTPGRAMDQSLDITEYRLTVGRSSASNRVDVRFYDDATDTETTGYAETNTGPLRSRGPAGVLQLYRDYPFSASQAQAQAFAESALISQQQAWCQVSITAVQDPRLEPDDIIDVAYMDRILRHRVTRVTFDLGTSAMRVDARTSFDAVVGGGGSAGGGGGGGIPPSDPLATTATAGTPGSFGPAGHRDPANLSELGTITAGAAWTPGQYVTVGGVDYYWDGSAWRSGRAPAAAATVIMAGQWKNVNPTVTLDYSEMTASSTQFLFHPYDADNINRGGDFGNVQAGDMIRIQQSAYDETFTISSVQVSLPIRVPVSTQIPPLTGNRLTTVTITRP